MTETYQVRDGVRLVSFDGVKLAEVSSQRSTSPRWTELTLYRTDTGRYVLSKIGRTVVLHMPGCPSIIGNLNRFVDDHPGEDPDEAPWEPHVCVAADADIDELLVEETRYWAVVADTAADIIGHLHRKDGGVTVLPRLSVNLLEQAAQVDADIADGFYVERV